MMEWIFIGMLLVVILFLIYLLKRKDESIEKRVEEKSQVNLMDWKEKYQKDDRKRSIRQSQASTIGKVTDHIAPFFKGFPYNPKDVRFLGSPIDLIVFDGLNENNLRGIIFIEIKTGESARLTENQKLIQDYLINNKPVIFRRHYIRDGEYIVGNS